MRLNQFLKEDQVALDFAPTLPMRPEDEDPDAPPSPRQLWAEKEAILEALVSLLDRSQKVGNRKKLLNDLVNRERKATTGLGNRIALPHVRTPNAKGFAMAVALVRSGEGLGFDSVDGEPVRVLIAMVAPAYDDRFYTKVERDLAAAFARGPRLVDELLAAASPGEVIRILSRETG
jgi:mannitol/fructose-specific phosphotransferase system IIA component (Ntr-type)